MAEVEVLSSEGAPEINEFEDIDDVILDDEDQIENFTKDLSYMSGAPYHP